MMIYRTATKVLCRIYPNEHAAIVTGLNWTEDDAVLLSMVEQFELGVDTGMDYRWEDQRTNRTRMMIYHRIVSNMFSFYLNISINVDR